MDQKKNETKSDMNLDKSSGSVIIWVYATAKKI